jgi:DNA (cytosine-5)-methyltransferase 1
MALLPSYARQPVLKFPNWKVTYIRQNREWLAQVRPYLDDSWIDKLKRLPPSFRKLEWNNAGGERNLWQCVLRFRPSGLRARPYDAVPALVAMTDYQRPILGPERRFLTRREALVLQGLPPTHCLPRSRDGAFTALGNAVHVKVVREIASRLFGATSTDGASFGQDGQCAIRVAEASDSATFGEAAG